MVKPRISWLAVLSISLAVASAFLAHGRDAVPLLAVPTSFLAIFMGVLSIWSIYRRPATLRGKPLAFSGVAVAAVSLATVLGLIFKFTQQNQRRQHGQMHLEQVLAASPASEESATNFSSNLPIMVLSAGGRYISKEQQTIVRAQLFEVKDGRAAVTTNTTYNGLAALNLRGSSTLRLPKHSYTFHTLDDQTNQTKVPLLGMPAEEDWVLYAPFEDKTLVRDVLAFKLAQKMGHYARTAYIELFLANPSRPLSMRDYAGVYVLTEKIKRSKERVNIEKLKPTDNAEPEITGGYLFKRDHSERREPRFRTEHGGPYFYVSPNAQQITGPQKAWLTRYMNAFEAALYGPDFKDPKTGYAAYLDVDSFIDAFWLIELAKNVDGFRYSSFITKDRGGKLKTEPPWDWNRAFGNADYYGGGETDGWYWQYLRPNEISWYTRLKQDPAFVQKCNARWAELRKGAFDPKQINGMIDEMTKTLDQAEQRNFKRWPIIGQPITTYHFVANSYDEEISWMKKWIEKRIHWIDSQTGYEVARAAEKKAAAAE